MDQEPAAMTDVEKYTADQQQGMAEYWIGQQITILEHQIRITRDPRVSQSLTRQLEEWTARDTLMRFGPENGTLPLVDAVKVKRASQTLGKPDSEGITDKEITEWAQDYLDYQARLNEQRPGK